MYGLFPLVMHEVVERLSDGPPFSLHVVWGGAYMVMSLRFAYNVTVQSVVVGAVLTGEAWEGEILRVPACFKASFSSVPHVSSLVVEEEGQPADCLRKDVCGGCSVNTMDYAANHVNHVDHVDHCEPCSLRSGIRCDLEIQPENFCWTWT